MVYRNAGSISLVIQVVIGLLAAVLVSVQARWNTVARSIRNSWAGFQASDRRNRTTS